MNEDARIIGLMGNKIDPSHAHSINGSNEIKSINYIKKMIAVKLMGCYYIRKTTNLYTIKINNWHANLNKQRNIWLKSLQLLK